MAKNVGKTECLNYLLGQLEAAGKRVALTSIGVDGERVDQVAGTPKPEIRIAAGTLFVTTERHYRERRLVAEILDVSDRQTALGRLVTARAVTAGKVLLSGPPDTRSLGEWIADAGRRGAEITLAEGALSRLSLASPTVAGGVILATGAAVSGSIRRVVEATRHVYDLMQLEEVDGETRRKLSGIEQGLHAIDDAGEVHDLRVPSAFLIEGHKEAILSRGATLFVAGAVSDALLQFLRVQREAAGITLIARDFTRVFARPESCRAFAEAGGRLRVLARCGLVAACANPVSPGGYRLDPDELLGALRESLRVPVYDIKRMEETCYSRKR
jgi:hypothetical protein